MKKIWIIAWNDTLIRLQDWNAMIFTLLAPILITGIMGLAVGGDNTESPLVSITIVNQDEGPFGKVFEALISKGTYQIASKLIKAQDLTQARNIVDSGKMQALIYVPRNFSAILQSTDKIDERQQIIQVNYSVDAAKKADSIYLRCAQVIRRLQALVVSKKIAASDLQVGSKQVVLPSQLDTAFMQELSSLQFDKNTARIEIKSASIVGRKIDRNPFAFFAPSLGIFFLMICMFDAPRSILVEKQEGTLGRLIRTPTSPNQVLLGKLSGSYLTGIVQFTLLVVATRLIFGLTWGHSLSGLTLMVVTVVGAYAGLGALVAAFSKNIFQAGAIGGAITLLSAGLGGNFFSADNLPRWLDVLSRLTINRWALDGFSKIVVRDLEVHDILLNAGVLIGIAISMLTIAFWKFQRQVLG